LRLRWQATLTQDNPVIQDLIQNIRALCSKPPPKGFEKYYKGATSATAGAKAEPKLSDGPKPEKTTESSSSGSSKPRPDATKPVNKNDWNFGMFGPSSSKDGGRGSGGSSGRPLGGEGGDKDKLVMLGVAGAIALVATIAYFEMGHKEIGWKEFVTK
jgi:AFG3 family protein